MKIKSCVSFLAAALVTGILGSATDADALYRRYHASWCNNMTPFSYAATGGSSGTGLSCPIVDDSSFNKTQVTTLNVHMFDGTTTDHAWAQVCVGYYGSSGGYCGAGDSTGGYPINDSFTGWDSVSPDLPPWGSTYASDFAYIYVDLPPSGSSGANLLKGYYTAG